MEIKCPICKQKILIWRKVKDEHFEFDCWSCNTRTTHNKERVYYENLVDLSKWRL